MSWFIQLEIRISKERVYLQGVFLFTMVLSGTKTEFRIKIAKMSYIPKHMKDEMVALLTCRRRALKLKQRRSKYRIQLSSSPSPDTSEA